MSDPTDTHKAEPSDVRMFLISEPDCAPIRAYDRHHCTIIERDLDGETGKHRVVFGDGFQGIAFEDELYPRGTNERRTR